MTATGTPPLDGCVVGFSGRFGPRYGHSQASLQAVVASLGGAVAKTAVAAVTHLVCTEADFAAATAKVETALRRRAHVVRPEWLLACEEQRALVAVHGHLWSTAAADDDDDDDAADAAAAPAAADDDAPAPAAGDGDGDGHDAHPHDKKRPVDDAADAPEADVSPRANKRRKGAEDRSAKQEKAVAEGQYAKAKDIVVELDVGCPLSDYQVHVDPDTGMIYDASLNQSSTSNNHNKFYRLQVLRNPASGAFKTWTRWGRVGETGQSAVLGNGTVGDAVRSFEKKFRDKAGLPWERRGDDPRPGKYAFVERNYGPDSDDDGDEGDGHDDEERDDADEQDPAPAPECSLDEPVQQLMELIFSQRNFDAVMSSFNYDANKLPLGKLSKATIRRGFQQLQDLASLLDDATLAQSRWGTTWTGAAEQLSNAYYSLIPHAFGRNRPPLITDQARLKAEIDLLESLSDMKAASDLLKAGRRAADGERVHPRDVEFRSLGLHEMTALDPAGDEFALLRRYLLDTRGHTHHVDYRVEQIFRVERQGEAARFADSRFASLSSDRRLLWHGSRTTNFGGILSQGLRIAPPEAPATGYMFGKGIYLADMSSKSANYCCASDSAGQALLLLCEAELGDPMQRLTGASYSAGHDAAAKAMVSTMGMGGVGPAAWTDAAAVHPRLEGVRMPDLSVKPGPTNVAGSTLCYNEYICYDVAQVQLRYLFRVSMT